MTPPGSPEARLLAELGLVVLERGWLSSNNVLFLPKGGADACLVDSGYATHAEQTASLVALRLDGRRLGRVINTHLHSDHCGGNARLAEQFGAELWIPEVSLDAVRTWDMGRLTYERSGQKCDRFVADTGIGAGQELRLGDAQWQAIAAPGHDPDALMFFQPESRVLISGDALWADALAIVFPALDGDADGFASAQRTLMAIERLNPRVVIPGHGPPFGDAPAALRASRQRLAAFAAAPQRHFAYALRALAMFRMLELREQERSELARWMERAPVLQRGAHAMRLSDAALADLVAQTLDRLISGGSLRAVEGRVVIASERRA